MVDPCCIENAERDPWPNLSDEYMAGGLSAIHFCEHKNHAGLELLGSLRALAAAFALVVVAVAWRRRG